MMRVLLLSYAVVMLAVVLVIRISSLETMMIAMVIVVDVDKIATV